MSEFLSDLAAKSGIDPDQAKKGLGALLSVLKDKLPADLFAKVQSAIPGGEGLTSAAEAGAEPSTGKGILGAVSDLAGKLFHGGGGVAAALAKLQGLGLSPEQGQSFLHNVMEFLQNKLPPDVMKKVSALIPAGAGTAG
jgi:hypothetical protein